MQKWLLVPERITNFDTYGGFYGLAGSGLTIFSRHDMAKGKKLPR
jgi:hypothetical protein